MRLVETGRVPDVLIRLGLRASLLRGVVHRRRMGKDQLREHERVLVEQFKHNAIATHPEQANIQHYDVPADFFQFILGKRLKYSCCLWSEGVHSIDEAEEAMLNLTCERARLQDGMEVLDLGCGWGSLTFWIVERYPNCRVLAVSNSRRQGEFIRTQATRMGFTNVEVQTADVNEFNTPRRFDRVISIEMFEHMKNYQLLMSRIASMLQAGGSLFVHVFCHRDFAFEFDIRDPAAWMARTFFAGGTMPSDTLLTHFQDDLKLLDHWRLSGEHYAKTLRTWLESLDRNREHVRTVIARTYGEHQQDLWLTNWRLFFMACEETFGLRNGKEFFISHYLFAKPE